MQVTIQFLQGAFTQLGLSIGNRSVAFDFMDEQILRNCEHFLPDPSSDPQKRKLKHICT